MFYFCAFVTVALFAHFVWFHYGGETGFLEEFGARMDQMSGSEKDIEITQKDLAVLKAMASKHKPLADLEFFESERVEGGYIVTVSETSHLAVMWILNAIATLEIAQLREACDLGVRDLAFEQVNEELEEVAPRLDFDAA